MEASRPPSADEINCLVLAGEETWAQGFLRLPSQAHHGRLRVVEEVPRLASADNLNEPLRLLVQNSAAGTPACVASGFVSHFGISMPVPPAFPVVVTVNAAVVGSDNPELAYTRVSLTNDGMLEFFDRAEISPEDVVKSGSKRQQRAAASFGQLDLKVFEVAKADHERTSVVLSWSGEITLEGEARPLSDWADHLVKALALFAFCVDRPLLPERIFAPSGQRDVEYYVRWQAASAPTSTGRLLADRRPDIPFSDMAAKWAELWQDAEHFLNHVNAFQIRRDRLTLDDRVLVLARSLELYHAYAKRFKSSIRSRPEHKRQRERVLSALPKPLRREHGEWIEDALSEANRKRLATQVQEILVDLGDDVQAACAIDDAEDFARMVTKSRNHFTHPKRKTPKKVPEGRGLVVLVNQLWFVLRACVLVELGVTRNDIASALRRSSQRHYLLHE